MFVIYIQDSKSIAADEFKFHNREALEKLPPYLTRSEAWEEAQKMPADVRPLAVILNKEKVLLTLARQDKKRDRKLNAARVTQLMAEHDCSRVWAYELLRRSDPSFVPPVGRKRGPKPLSPEMKIERRKAKLRAELKELEAKDAD